METNFTCYTKKVQGEIFYFVKKFVFFPELPNTPPMQEAFGMHTNFDKACSLAQLFDDTVKKQLLQEIETGVRQAKVIDLSEANFKHQRPAFGM